MKKNKKSIKIILVATAILLTIVIYIFLEKDKNNSEIIDYNETEKIENISENKKEETKNKIKVYITGEIKNSGVFEIEENSRVIDIIEVAGGVTENANIDQINLASILEDGMKICIPNKNEKIKNVEDNYKNLENREINVNSEQQIIKNKKVNINTANQKDLENLPGIGQSTALKIIIYRKEKGKFKKIEDIKNISGIGESKFNKIKDFITV